MASLSIGGEEKLLIDRYMELENEKLFLERALREIEAQKIAKRDKINLRCKENSAKEKQMLELLNTYRLTGISVKEKSDSTTTLIFDTCYKDQYFESYLLELNTIQNDVVRHTMPYFVPCNALAQQHLPDHLHIFATAISSHVCSYVKRRQQCLETKVQFKDYFSKPLEHSVAYDFVRLDLIFNFTTYITIVINYQLDCDLPDKIVAFVHNTDTSLKPWCEETFAKHYLEVATKQLVDRLT